MMLMGQTLKWREQVEKKREQRRLGVGGSGAVTKAGLADRVGPPGRTRRNNRGSGLGLVE